MKRQLQITIAVEAKSHQMDLDADEINLENLEVISNDERIVLSNPEVLDIQVFE
jgi:hypothetical protein